MTIAEAWWARGSDARPDRQASGRGDAPASTGAVAGDLEAVPVPRLRSAVVLGAGTMGAQVACLLAGRGVAVDLLDLDATTARAGLDRARKLSPTPLYLPDDADAIHPAGFDTLETAVEGADWVLEAVVERLDVKRDLLARTAAVLPPEALLSTNTSSLSVSEMAAVLAPDVAARFLGTHFFNPPRYARLVELVPAPATSADTLARARAISAEILGKGVVAARDVPGFIVNRLGTQASLAAIRLRRELGLGIDEVDDLSGPLVGRPRSAVFRTIDLVGLDVFAAVVNSLAAGVPSDDPERDLFVLPAAVEAMLARGMLGTKSGSGFYRKTGDEILALDLETLEYRPRRRARSAAVEAARQLEDPGARLAALLAAPESDAPATFVRRSLVRALWYAAAMAPSIAGSVADVDRGMRWGLGWERGPFETWDAIGDDRMAALLARDGLAEPPLARAAREAGGFYAGDGTLQLRLDADRAEPGIPAQAVRTPEAAAGPRITEPARAPVPRLPRAIELHLLRARGGAISGNGAASLLEVDGALALELHGKLNIIGLDTIEMLVRATDTAEARGLPLVVATDAADFSAGANVALLLMEAEDDEWDVLDRVTRRFQSAMRGLRRASVPVVVAVRGRVLGGGAEIAVAGDRVQAAAETYMGFVELGMGLIPAGGGSTEMARRAAACDAGGTWGDAFPAFARAFEAIATAKVSSSAQDARRIGLLRAEDGISMDPGRVVADALSVAHTLLRTGYRPALERPIRVLGRRGIAAAESLTHNQLAGGYISAYDRELAVSLARVMCGGDVAEGTEVGPDHLLDLERETFLRLLGQPKTRDRIRHFLRAGKPLRN
jgi:3-hydroxyacyl-CoA dehydrogenase